MALIENNARVGAEVAIRLAELKRKVREEAGVNGDLKEVSSCPFSMLFET